MVFPRQFFDKAVSLDSFGGFFNLLISDLVIVQADVGSHVPIEHEGFLENQAYFLP